MNALYCSEEQDVLSLPQEQCGARDMGLVSQSQVSDNVFQDQGVTDSRFSKYSSERMSEETRQILLELFKEDNYVISTE